MKKSKRTYLIQALSLVVMSLVLPGCRSSDDTAPVTNPLLGLWDRVRNEFVECPDPANNYVVNCSNNCLLWKFNSDGTLEQNTDGFTIKLSYVVGGNKLHLCYNNICEDYTYSISGTTLIIIETATNECLTKDTFIRS